MKKFLFAAVCLFLCCVAFSHGKSKFLSDVQYKPKMDIEKCLKENIYTSACLDSCAGMDGKTQACIEYEKKFWAWYEEANKDYYNGLAAQEKQAHERRREIIVFSILLAGPVIIILAPIFVFVKNKFNHIKNKTKLHHKQRAGKHTLDDVFAAEKKE